jgi:hypothetical protein
MMGPGVKKRIEKMGNSRNNLPISFDLMRRGIRIMWRSGTTSHDTVDTKSNDFGRTYCGSSSARGARGYKLLRIGGGKSHVQQVSVVVLTGS